MEKQLIFMFICVPILQTVKLKIQERVMSFVLNEVFVIDLMRG